MGQGSCHLDYPDQANDMIWKKKKIFTVHQNDLYNWRNGRHCKHYNCYWILKSKNEQGPDGFTFSYLWYSSYCYIIFADSLFAIFIRLWNQGAKICIPQIKVQLSIPLWFATNNKTVFSIFMIGIQSIE